MRVCRSKDNFLKLVLAFYHLAFGEGVQVIRLGIRCSYPLNHLAVFFILFYFFKWKSSYQPQQPFLKWNIMQSRDLLIWRTQRGGCSGKQLHLVSHNWAEVSIGAEPFTHSFHPWPWVWTECLRPHSLGVFILQMKCLSGVQSRVAAKLHGAAQLSAPRNTWDSFHLELEYIFDDFCVLKNFFFYP